jgi:hypothetical protein
MEIRESQKVDLSSRVTVGGDVQVSKSKGLEFQGRMLVQMLRYLGYSSAHLTVSSLGYTFLGGWAKNPKHLWCDVLLDCAGAKRYIKALIGS